MATSLQQRRADTVAGLRARGAYQRWVLITCLVGVLATSFPVTILTVSLGDIAKDFDTSETTIAWVVSAPMLAGAVEPASRSTRRHHRPAPGVPGRLLPVGGHRCAHGRGMVGPLAHRLPHPVAGHWCRHRTEFDGADHARDPSPRTGEGHGLGGHSSAQDRRPSVSRPAGLWSS
ncbi:MAG: hypothetical protein R2710_00775 [Acidimicrobiales bacterium]